MADRVPDTWPPENMNLQTPNCPIVTAVSALGGNPPNFSGSGAPVLSNLWVQPHISHLSAQLTAGNGRIQSSLPPGASHLQNIHGEHPQLPTVAACNPPVSEWRSGDPPQTFYAPLPPQYPIEQIYRPSHLQHLPSAGSEAAAWAQTASNIGLRLVQRQPLEHRPSQPASLQEENYPYNHGTFPLIPLGERNPIPQRGSSFPVLPSPTSHMVLILKEVEPQISETSVPAGPSRASSMKASPANLKVKGVYLRSEKNHQSPPSWAEGEGTLLADFMDEFHVPQELLTEFPDFEQLISSVEPFLPESLFPCPDSKETREGIVFQENSSKFSLPENAVGAGLSQCDRDQSQDLPCLAAGTLGIASSSEPHMDPSGGKLSAMPTSPGKEGARQVIHLCSSDEEFQEVTGGQPSDSSIHPVKELGKKSLWSRVNDRLQGLEAIVAGNVLVPTTHQKRKQDMGPMKSLGKKRKSSNGQSKVQDEGKLQNSQKATGTKGKRRYPKTEGEEAPKPVPRTNLALQMMKSVQVLYPLGKSNISSTLIKKVHSLPSHTLPPPEDFITKVQRWSKSLADPSSQPLTKPPLQYLAHSSLHPQYKPPSYPMTKVASHSLPKPSSHYRPMPPSHPWQKLPFLPGPTQQPKPLWSQVPRAPIPLASTPLEGHFPHPRVWRALPQARAAEKTTSLGIKPADLAPNLGQSSHIQGVAKGPVPEDPSSSPPYEGATFIPWRTPPHDLEVSEAITEEQRPLRERMKREAQREREEAAHWTSVGRIQFFVEREKEMEISIGFGYPKFGYPWQ